VGRLLSKFKKMKTLILNGNIVNEAEVFRGSILIEESKISQIFRTEISANDFNDCKIVDAKGKYILPGVIDDQVHFREPGLTEKAEIQTESRAAVAGGITSFMEMPNTIPQTTTQKLLEEKYELASKKSIANYSFYIGATNQNIDELLKTNPRNVCGIKIFMGSSTGNMLVDDKQVLAEIFAKAKLLIATHCEDEATIKKNTALFREKYGENLPIAFHPKIRSSEACYTSSSFAVELSKKFNTRLHVLHLSTAKETELFENQTLAKNKRITAEVCVHHLWFDDNDYEKFGSRIKWNPAIKTENDKNTLLKAVLENKIDVIASDHAPHTISEKNNSYFKAPSGGPLVQHTLVAMLEMFHKKQISLEKIVEKMCHTPAEIFQIEKRGYIREGYWADIAIVDLNKKWKVTKDNILYKCKWSPFENQEFQSKVTHTFVNGHLAHENGILDESKFGMRLLFDR